MEELIKTHILDKVLGISGQINCNVQGMKLTFKTVDLTLGVTMTVHTMKMPALTVGVSEQLKKNNINGKQNIQ